MRDRHWPARRPSLQEPAMTDPVYPAPPRPTLDDLDPESATTDQLVALVRSHRAGEEYPTGEQLLGHLPKVLRARSRKARIFSCPIL